MTRIRSAPDQNLNAGFLAEGVLNAHASGSIAAGELCAMHEGGFITRVDPRFPWAAINQNDPTPITIYDITAVANISLTGMTIANAVGHPKHLPGGAFIIPMQNSTGVGFHIRGPHGLQISDLIIASSDTSSVPPLVVVLPGGGNSHVVVWASGANLRARVYDANNNPISAQFTIANNLYVAGPAPWFHAVAAVSVGVNGWFVSWTNTSGALVGQYFDADGAHGSLITIDTTIQGGLFGTHPCSNGEHILILWDGAHSRHKVYRVNISGAVVWGPITPSAVGAYFSQPILTQFQSVENRFFELVNGNIACLLPNTGGYANVFVLNSSGTLINTVDFGTLYHDINVAAPITFTPNGFVVCHTPNSSSSTYASFYDINGFCLQENVVIDSSAPPLPTGQTGVVNLYAALAGPNISVHRYFKQVQKGIIHLQHVLIDQIGHAFSGKPVIVLQNPISSDMGAPIPVSTVHGITFSAWFASGSLQLTVTVSKAGRSSVIGVAANDAADGDPITINAAGEFILPATQIFGPGQAFDQRGQPVWGCRGLVGGRKAYLAGWV